MARPTNSNHRGTREHRKDAASDKPYSGARRAEINGNDNAPWTDRLFEGVRAKTSDVRTQPTEELPQRSRDDGWVKAYRAEQDRLSNERER